MSKQSFYKALFIALFMGAASLFTYLKVGAARSQESIEDCCPEKKAEKAENLGFDALPRQFFSS